MGPTQLFEYIIQGSLYYLKHSLQRLKYCSQVAQNVEAGGEAAGDGEIHDVADLEEARVSLNVFIKCNLRTTKY